MYRGDEEKITVIQVIILIAVSVLIGLILVGISYPIALLGFYITQKEVDSIFVFLPCALICVFLLFKLTVGWYWEPPTKSDLTNFNRK